MKIYLQGVLLVLLVSVISLTNAQNGFRHVAPPQIIQFSGALQFLASPVLEGREPGTRGASVASAYIAGRMQSMGLKTYKKGNFNNKTVLSDYYQPFSLGNVSVEKVLFSIPATSQNAKPLVLIPGKDFSVENLQQNISTVSELVFAGYGINLPQTGYNDFQNINVKGKLAVILSGYPGERDSLSTAWVTFRSLAENDSYDLTERCNEAARQGAVAVVVINENYLRQASSASGMPEISKDDTLILEPESYLPGQQRTPSVPRIVLSEGSSRMMEKILEINFRKVEQSIAQLKYHAGSEKACPANLSIQLVFNTITVHNVLGLLPGKDTTHTIILGAHYDHLGMRGNTIFYGSDDNASGVAGLLALAEMWTRDSIIPPCNILFASWTAEEKGLIGSEYYVSTLPYPEKVKLYINMDMISRSVKEDTACRQLSIGTRLQDNQLRELAREKNSTLEKPFVLDLWDVTGHSGSDYASFTAKNIPVMTYNTGLHDDYHTPRDIPESADLVKMQDVLEVVNGCLESTLQNMPTK
jgi:hypothetical protein